MVRAPQSVCNRRYARLDGSSHFAIAPCPQSIDYRHYYYCVMLVHASLLCLRLNGGLVRRIHIYGRYILQLLNVCNKHALTSMPQRLSHYAPSFLFAGGLSRTELLCTNLSVPITACWGYKDGGCVFFLARNFLFIFFCRPLVIIVGSAIFRLRASVIGTFTLPPFFCLPIVVIIR